MIHDSRHIWLEYFWGVFVFFHRIQWTTSFSHDCRFTGQASSTRLLVRCETTTCKVKNDVVFILFQGSFERVEGDADHLEKKPDSLRNDELPIIKSNTDQSPWLYKPDPDLLFCCSTETMIRNKTTGSANPPRFFRTIDSTPYSIHWFSSLQLFVYIIVSS